MTCTKRRNKLLVDKIRNKFFLNVLSFPQHSTTEYTKEIKVATEGKKFPPYQLEFYCFYDLTVFLCPDIVYAINVVINNIQMYFSFIHTSDLIV